METAWCARVEASSACRGLGPPNNQPVTGNGQSSSSEEASSEICLPGLDHLGDTTAFDRTWPALDSSNCANLMSCGDAIVREAQARQSPTMWSLAVISQHPGGQVPGAPSVSEPTVMLKLYLCSPVFSESFIDLHIVGPIHILRRPVFVGTKEFILFTCSANVILFHMFLICRVTPRKQTPQMWRVGYMLREPFLPPFRPITPVAPWVGSRTPASSVDCLGCPVPAWAPASLPYSPSESCCRKEGDT